MSALGPDDDRHPTPTTRPAQPTGVPGAWRIGLPASTDAKPEVLGDLNAFIEDRGVAVLTVEVVAPTRAVAVRYVTGRVRAVLRIEPRR